MGSIDWKALLEALEGEAASLHGERMRTMELKQKVEQALSAAEGISANSEVVNRLDLMLMMLTEAVKENVCNNTKCPHYSKKCKMR